MKRMKKQTRRWQQGQAIVLVALMIVALTGMLALTVDVGSAFQQRRELQAVARAAAMAGTHLGMEQIRNAGGTQDYAAQKAVAIKFANLNGVFSPPDTITIVWVNAAGTAFTNTGGGLPIVPGGQVVQGMKVTISGSRSTYMFQVFGIPSVNVTVTAMAQFGTANAIVGAAPLMMNNDTNHTSTPLYAPVLVTTDNGGPARRSGRPTHQPGAVAPLIMNTDTTHTPTPLYAPVLATPANGGRACCSAGQNDSLGYAIP